MVRTYGNARQALGAVETGVALVDRSHWGRIRVGGAWRAACRLGSSHRCGGGWRRGWSSHWGCLIVGGVWRVAFHLAVAAACGCDSGRGGCSWRQWVEVGGPRYEMGHCCAAAACWWQAAPHRARQ